MAEASEPQGSAPADRPAARGGRGRQPRDNHLHVTAKRPIPFYTGLARRLLGEYDEVHFSGLGMAASSVATSVELLRRDGIAVVTKVTTSLSVLPEIASRGLPRSHKPKLEVSITKSPEYDEIMLHEKQQRAELEAAQAAAHAAATADALGNLNIGAT